MLPSLGLVNPLSIDNSHDLIGMFRSHVDGKIYLPPTLLLASNRLLIYTHYLVSN